MLAFWIISALTLVLVITTLAPFSSSKVWWVRIWDFPRLQETAIALFLLIASATFLPAHQPSTWVLVALQLACGAWHLWWIFPYTPFAERTVARYRRKHEPSISDHLRILTVNVLEPNRNAIKLLKLIHQHRPDIVVAVETDSWWMQQLDEMQDHLPYVQRCPLDNLYGMLVYSKWPLVDAETRFMVEPQVPSMHFTLQLPNSQVRMHCVHPAPPSPTENEKSRERDKELQAVARIALNETGPVIVTGDLNDVAWSRSTRTFMRISKLLDPRMGRGIYNTFHAKIPLLRWPLDHIFHSPHFMLVKIKRLPAFGSDHFALLTELALKK
ncbi:endonuclease/exonuclease/phosphatase family protein [Pseudidiomarina sp. PP-1MA]|uniref:Endonuclease/exonuclease/phosphatase family protein n=1 Tax=Pseudidiomarina sp. PP-1MA TaxID=3237706 RepID=A0AB39X699_9GAMM